MGRVKLQIKKIESNTNKQVTFSKRRNGLIKKAYELSILCDIDIALIMFSPSDRLNHFSGRQSIEDVFVRYINLPERDRGGANVNKEYLTRILDKLQLEGDRAAQLANPGSGMASSQTEELQQKVSTYKQQLHLFQERLRFFEPDPSAPLPSFSNLCELESCENFLMESLAHVCEKKSLLDCHLPWYDPSTASLQMYLQSQNEEMANAFSYDHVQCLPDTVSNHSYPMFENSDHFMSLRNQGMYDSVPVQMEPQMEIDTWQWHQAYTSEELLTALMLPTPLPLMQNPLATAELPPVDGATSCLHVPVENDTCGGGFENN